MGTFFRVDGPFFRFMEAVADCFLLSILWLLFSLPVFTVGASTSALYYCVIKVIREQDGSVIRTFWDAFRQNFKQGTLAVLIFAVGGVLVTCFGTAVYRANPSQQTLQSVYLVYLCTVLVAAAWAHYLLSYIARFENSMKNALKNTLIICLMNLPQSFLITVTFAAVVAVFVLFLPISILGLFFVPGVYVLMTSFLLERIFKKYLPKEDAAIAETEV